MTKIQDRVLMEALYDFRVAMDPSKKRYVVTPEMVREAFPPEFLECVLSGREYMPDSDFKTYPLDFKPRSDYRKPADSPEETSEQTQNLIDYLNSNPL